MFSGDSTGSVTCTFTMLGYRNLKSCFLVHDTGFEDYETLLHLGTWSFIFL